MPGVENQTSLLEVLSTPEKLRIRETGLVMLVIGTYIRFISTDSPIRNYSTQNLGAYITIDWSLFYQVRLGDMYY